MAAVSYNSPLFRCELDDRMTSPQALASDPSQQTHRRSDALLHCEMVEPDVKGRQTLKSRRGYTDEATHRNPSPDGSAHTQ